MSARFSAWCLVLLAGWWASPAIRSAADERPNVLFIAVDDLRPELNCYGATQIKSPHIDRLAGGGVLFQRAYCQQAVCNPSRTSLMTGLRPDTIGVTGNHIHFRDNRPGVVTLPQHFKNQGYHAQAIGKIYHGVFPDGASNTRWDTMGDPQSWSVPPVRFGPRYYYTEAGVAAAREAYRKTYQPSDPAPEEWTEKLVFGLATESPQVPDETLYDGQVAAAAIQALRQRKQEPQQPFFLAVGFIKPHSPYVAPQKYFDLYDDVSIATRTDLPLGAPSLAGHGSGELRRYTDQPERGPFDRDNQRRLRRAYFACVSFVDEQIGRVLNELDRLGLSGKTIVCLYGDHGYHLGEQGLWGKTTNFELDTRVPLIVRAPGMKARGQKTTSLVELLDLYPTLVELAGLPSPGHLEGQSFARLLDDPSQSVRQFARSQYPRRPGLMGYSMRTSDYRLTQWVHRETGTVRATELYDYAQGMIETDNLAGQAGQADRVARLSVQLSRAFGIDSSTQTVPRDSARVLQDETFSFEQSPPGRFQNLATPLGVWHTTAGEVLIDSKHARTGQQCLQITGGQGSVVELVLADGINTNGRLQFWAERWTSRNPFRFRIDKQVEGTWVEVFNGDRQVRVGRAFLSRVDVPLNDPGIERLRFSVTSPPATGVLLDDIALVPSRPQEISSVEVVPHTLPSLKGSPASALLKLKVVTAGTQNPIRLQKLDVAFGTESRSLLRSGSLQVCSTGSSSSFATQTVWASGRPARAGASFEGDGVLQEGDNYFWVSGQISESADLDQFIHVRGSRATFSNGQQFDLKDAGFPQRLGVAVRRGGDAGVHTYRIPGLATTTHGTLIGVYDVRRRGGGDLPGDIDVGMSRSTDGGRTWEPMKIIMDMGDDPRFRFDGIGDPSILVDQGTGTIWVAATWSHGDRSWRGSQPGLDPADTGQLILVRSDDDGVTWSNPINITKQVKKPEWCFLLQGPGKGITMSDGTIVFPAQYQDPPDLANRRRHRLPHSTFIYSRDHGETWQIGSGAHDDTTEAQLVELAAGEIMINCRFNRQNRRVVMTTSDMGRSWQEHPTNRLSLIEPGACMASLINVGRELGKKTTDWLLFSNPASVERRHRITIKASPDRGRSWPESCQLLLDEQPGAGYSCMSMIDEDTVGILYEGSQAQMTFQRVKLADIFGELAPSRSPGELKPEPDGLSVSRVFGDHMVLQAGQPIRIWGSAPAGQPVTVSIGKATRSAETDRAGRWQVELPARKASLHPTRVLIRAGAEQVVLRDVLIGEVWFCAGQSNMEWPVSKSEGGPAVVASAADSHLRLMNFAGAARGGAGVYGQELLERLEPGQFCAGNWKLADPESVGEFSAIGYSFALQLRQELDCPVGMVNVAIGGTPIEAWISSDVLGADEELSRMLDRDWLENSELDDWCRNRARFNLARGLNGELSLPRDKYGPGHSFKPGFMYASAVAPFTPMSIRGVLWYQGESNADNRHRVQQYHRAFPVLVDSWRRAFQNQALPIGFVQLPALNRPHWPAFREYQRRSLARLNDVGMAVAIDTGDRSNVHPVDKRVLGGRLACWALVRCYGGNGPSAGPLLREHRATGDRIVLRFANMGSGLRTADGQPPNQFEVAGNDGVFHPAVAQIESNQVVLTSMAVDRPRHARYAWSPYPEPRPNVINSAGLPMSPFTTQEEF